MQLVEKADVLTADGKKVGLLDRVVLDPRSREVTAIIVRKGAGLREDKVVPVDMIESANGEIHLRQDAEAVAALEPFEETHYVVVDERDLVRELGTPTYASPLYGYPPFPGMGPAVPTPIPPRPSVIAKTEENIPANSVALRAGAKVLDREGQPVGSIEGVLTDHQARRATHFVIARGLVMKERKLVPAHWVQGVGEDNVRLAVGVSQVQRLQPYQD